jgi:hypothetical protein
MTYSVPKKVGTGTDADALDGFYEDCMQAMSEGFCTVNKLLDEKKVKEAAKEFQSSFSVPMTKFYFQAKDLAPSRYSEDKRWKYRVKELYDLTMSANSYLKAGKIERARDKLDKIRDFFYNLHATNKMDLTNDAIYAFKYELDKAMNARYVKGNTSDVLEELKSKIPEADPSVRVGQNKEQFDTDFKNWVAEVDKVLSDSYLSRDHIAKLQDITDEFYTTYGMAFE